MHVLVCVVCLVVRKAVRLVVVGRADAGVQSNGQVNIVAIKWQESRVGEKFTFWKQ